MHSHIRNWIMFERGAYSKKKEIICNVFCAVICQTNQRFVYNRTERVVTVCAALSVHISRGRAHSLVVVSIEITAYISAMEIKLNAKPIKLANITISVRCAHYIYVPSERWEKAHTYTHTPAHWSIAHTSKWEMVEKRMRETERKRDICTLNALSGMYDINLNDTVCHRKPHAGQHHPVSRGRYRFVFKFLIV